MLCVLLFLGLVVLVVVAVDAGFVWDIAFFDPLKNTSVFFVFRTSPNAR